MNIQKLSLIWATLLVSACTLPQGSFTDTPKLPEFESIAVVSMGADDDLKARFNRDSTKSGAGAGAAAGAAAGASAAIVCGPFYILCALGGGAVGAVVGAVGGAAGGAIVDAKRQPSEEELVQLETNFEAISENRVIHEEIETATVEQVPEQYRVAPKEADALIELTLNDVRFTHVTDGAFALELVVNVVAQWNRGTRALRSSRRVYSCKSSAESIDYWADEDGERLNEALSSCISDLAEDLGDDMRFPAPEEAV